MTELTFEAFFDRHYEPVVRSLAVALGDPREAEDLAQEAFTRALRKWRQVATYERPATWVYVVAVRAGGRRFSNPGLSASRTDVAPDPGPGVATSLWLLDALDVLAPRQRLAVVLRFLADLPVAEVAEVMGCAVGTVKSTLHTALRHLRVELIDSVAEGDFDDVYS